MNPKLKKLLVSLLILAVLAAVSYFFGIDLLDPSVDASTGSTQTSQSTAPSTRPSETVKPSETTKPTEATQPTQAPTTKPTEAKPAIDEDGFYYSKEDVALYIHTYGKLPENFVTKKEAKDEFGSNYKAMKAGYRIGGDTFGNREGRLPKKSGRTWTECDIVAEGGTERGAKRIVFSNDGLVYYTDDHYESFTLLYGEP